MSGSPRLAVVLCGLTILLAGAQPVLLASGGMSLWTAEAFDHAFPLVLLGASTGSVVGVLILSRHPRHRIGWVFVLGQLGFAAAQAAEAYGWAVLDGTLPGPAGPAHLAAWFANTSSIFLVTSLALLALLAPNGDLPTRRWRPVLHLLGASVALAMVGLLQVPPALMEPAGPSRVGLLPTVLVGAGQIGLTVGLALSGLALVLRLHRAAGEERQQLRWFAVAAAVSGATLVVMVAHNLARGGNVAPDWRLALLFSLSILGIPLAVGFAVLRYRLYDVDVVIGAAVKAGVLSVFVTVGYVAVVTVTATLLGRFGPASYLASVLALVVVALAFQPLRRRLDSLAHRVVYGRRADPYEALAAFGRSLAQRLPDAAVLPRVAEVVASATGASQVTATLLVPGHPPQTAAWTAAPVDPAGSTATFPVVHHQDRLGEISVRLARGWSLTRAQHRLATQIARQAGLAFRNVQLVAALQAEAERLARDTRELAASRRRLLLAADRERHHLVRALDRQVGRHLEPIADDLARLPELMRQDPAAASRLLHRQEERAGAALDALRVLSHGVFPAQLASHGVAAALESYRRRHPFELSTANPVGTRRLPEPVQTTAYFCTVESLAAVEDGAVALSLDDHQLHIDIAGRPTTPVPADLAQQLADRVGAVGGRVGCAAAPDGWLRVRVSLPTHPPSTGSR